MRHRCLAALLWLPVALNGALLAAFCVAALTRGQAFLARRTRTAGYGEQKEVARIDCGSDEDADDEDYEPAEADEADDDEHRYEKVEPATTLWHKAVEDQRVIHFHFDLEVSVSTGENKCADGGAVLQMSCVAHVPHADGSVTTVEWNSMVKPQRAAVWNDVGCAASHNCTEQDFADDGKHRDARPIKVVFAEWSGFCTAQMKDHGSATMPREGALICCVKGRGCTRSRRMPTATCQQGSGIFGTRFPLFAHRKGVRTTNTKVFVMGTHSVLLTPWLPGAQMTRSSCLMVRTTVW